MAIQKDVEVLGGFTATYHNVDKLEWDKGSKKVTIHMASYKDSVHAKSYIAADRTVIVADSATPLLQADAYGVVKQDDKFSGGKDV